MKKIFNYISFIFGTILFVFISTNYIFTHLHDGGQIGMMIGIFSFQILFVLVAYRLKWWIVILLLIALLLNIPLTLFCMKYIYYAFVNPENGTPIAFEICGYVLYFCLAILFIEVATFFDAKYKSNSSN